MSTKQVHDNSILSYYELKRDGRYAQIIHVYEFYEKPMTDREVANYLKRPDLNYVRPRITELIDMFILIECGSVKDESTHRSVRITRLATIEERAGKQLTFLFKQKGPEQW